MFKNAFELDTNDYRKTMKITAKAYAYDTKPEAVKETRRLKSKKTKATKVDPKAKELEEKLIRRGINADITKEGNYSMAIGRF